MTATITTRCVIDGMTDETYHADPVVGGSLSSTGARAILSSPARYRWDRDHRIERHTFDVGHAAHAKVLGVGMGIIEIPAEHLTASGNVSTKVATQAWLIEQRAAGLVPVTPDDMSDVDAMAEAVLAHPEARTYLERDGAKSEQSLFAPDDQTGAWLRARIDLLALDGAEPLAADLKTTGLGGADPEEFARTAANYGYDIQSEFYPHVLRQALGLDDIAAFRFIAVEKVPPYLVSVIELDAEYAVIGRTRVRRAIDTYARCRETNTWPGYQPVVHYVAAPRWLAIEEGIGF